MEYWQISIISLTFAVLSFLIEPDGFSKAPIAVFAVIPYVGWVLGLVSMVFWLINVYKSPMRCWFMHKWKFSGRLHIANNFLIMLDNLKLREKSGPFYDSRSQLYDGSLDGDQLCKKCGKRSRIDTGGMF